MSRKPHDISGGIGALLMTEQMRMVQMIIYSILAWFSITIECFLRRDFGERYYTLPNFLIGFLAMLLFFVGFSAIASLNPLGSGQRDVAMLPYMVLLAYMVLSAFHFWKIWVNAQVGAPQHSLYDGTSHLQPIGELLMKILNPLLAIGVIFLGRFTLGNENFKRLTASLKVSPVLTNSEKFTKVFLEPVVIIALAFTFSTLAFWLWVSFFAHTLYTRMRFEYRRFEELDITDGIIEAAFSKEDLERQRRLSIQTEQAREVLQEKATLQPEAYQENRE